MSTAENKLAASDTWRTKLGVLPVPLTEADDRRFVMLNGVAGNFCLDATEDEAASARAIAWSADVGHYVQLLGDTVLVYRWDAPQYQRVPKALVATGIERFQRLLENDEPTREASVVQHVVGVLDRLRSTVPGGKSGDALCALLVLLGCNHSNRDLQDLDIERYGIDKGALAVAKAIHGATWQGLKSELRAPASQPGLHFDASIALRHCSGQVFQEAHWRTTALSNQLTFPGVIPARAKVSRSERAEFSGVYFTPSPIVRTLTEHAIKSVDLSKPQLTVFDPACGSGEFLAESARQLRQRGYAGRLILKGYDLSEHAVATARFVLHGQFAGDPRNQINVDLADSLDISCQWPDADMLFMNPPFVSWWDMSRVQRDKIKSILGPNAQSKPDYSAAFIQRALDAKPSIIGAVLITSALDSQSFKKLRDEWLGGYSVDFVARLGNLSIFKTATIDSALVIGQRGVTDSVSTMLWTDQSAPSVSAGLRALRRGPSARRGDGYSVYSDRIDSAKSTWSPRPLESIDLLQLNSALPKVCDMFDVRQGVITGLNSAFVLTESAINDLPPKERKYFRPAILNVTLRNCRVLRSHYVWYPYRNGTELFGSESAARDAAKEYFKRYLTPRKDELSKRRGMHGRWWELIWPRLDRSGPKIVTTYYGDVGSFAYDADDRYAVVQGYAWYPRKKNHQLIFETGVAYAYVAFLNTRLFMTALSGHARIVGGGQVDLSKRFLAETPIPNLYEGIDPSIVVRLETFGRQLSDGVDVDRIALEQLARTVYGHG